jgi:hypothetical protein
VFDAGGNFVAQWPVNEWQQPNGFEDLAVDSETGKVYASSAHQDSVMVFGPDGTRMPALKAENPARLEGATALALLPGKLYVLCASSSRVIVINR